MHKTFGESTQARAQKTWWCNFLQNSWITLGGYNGGTNIIDLDLLLLHQQEMQQTLVILTTTSRNVMVD